MCRTNVQKLTLFVSFCGSSLGNSFTWETHVKKPPKRIPVRPQTPNSTTKFKMLKNYKMQQDCSYMRQNLPVESM